MRSFWRKKGATITCIKVNLREIKPKYDENVKNVKKMKYFLK